MAEFHKSAEAEDPFEATAVFVESPPGYDGVAAMARAFIEEYAMAGWSRDRILRLFQNPRYAGTHAVYHQRGEAFVHGLLDDVLRVDPAREVGHA
jgi:hypothetical protein